MTNEDAVRVPPTEEEIRAATVGELIPLTSRIELVESDPERPRLVAREDGRIRSLLGDRVLRLEHTGSTSIPERTKRALAASDWKDVQNYADAKTEIVQAIIARALRTASE